MCHPLFETFLIEPFFLLHRHIANIGNHGRTTESGQPEAEETVKEAAKKTKGAGRSRWSHGPKKTLELRYLFRITSQDTPIML